MLAELVPAPFDNKDWVFEVKFDGYRALADCNGNGKANLYSRNLLSFNEAYPPIIEELKKITHACLLDGEIVIEDAKGRSRFQLMQNYKGTGKGNLKYYVFDLLSLDGKDTMALPLLQRKELLRMLLRKSRLKNVIYSQHIKEKGKDFYKLAVKRGLEGIMAKDALSTYTPAKRNGTWLKVKITNEEEAIICGFTEPKGSRHYFGSLILGIYEKDVLRYIGHCGTGFDNKMLGILYRKFKPLFIKKSPFAHTFNVNAKVQWLKPTLVCQVKFTEWTAEHIMRNPVYLGLRIDKSAKEVTEKKYGHMKTEKIKTAKTKNASKTAPDIDESDLDLKIGKVTLKLTNQQKIYWPEEQISKGDLVDYYSEIAPVILPYLKDRPESMHRFPDGIKTAGFYQKDVDTKTIPAWLHTEKVYSESNKKNLDYLICNDKATLIYMANLGCIEINPWNSRLNHIQNPDWLVIDLDPEQIDFTAVVKTALATRKVFEQLEIESFCKTSGATGLHIFVPLAAKYEYEVVRNFGHLVAQRVNELLPDITSIERMPQKRRKKVYLDFLQNSRGQTLASPYSVRPRPGATVSTPLQWEEINSRLKPTSFTINTILKRLDKKGDLWKSVLGPAANLKKALQVISKED